MSRGLKIVGRGRVPIPGQAAQVRTPTVNGSQVARNAGDACLALCLPERGGSRRPPGTVAEILSARLGSPLGKHSRTVGACGNPRTREAGEAAQKRR